MNILIDQKLIYILNFINMFDIKFYKYVGY